MTFQRTVQRAEASKTISAETVGRQFVEDPQWKPKDRDTLELINLLLLEKISLAGIVRASGVSGSWLQDYVNDRYATVPQTVTVEPKAKGKLTVQMDEI